MGNTLTRTRTISGSLVLRESTSISRKKRDVLITRHRLGFVSANAGIDCSNARPAHAQPSAGPWALLLPENPDAEAKKLREEAAALLVEYEQKRAAAESEAAGIIAAAKEEATRLTAEAQASLADLVTRPGRECSVSALQARLGATTLAADGVDARLLINCNTPDDWREANA
jgi:cell division septum initiation protein DivIVA